jgi:hypothetical protein
MQRPMPYTLAEAAKATGTNKTTILRAIKSGKVSGTKDAHGEWLVEPVELHRVYPLAEPRSGRTAASRAATQQDAAVRAAVLEAENKALKAQLDDTRQQRDHWQQQAQAVTRQLADQRPRGGLFSRLFGKAD